MMILSVSMMVLSVSMMILSLLQHLCFNDDSVFAVACMSPWCFYLFQWWSCLLAESETVPDHAGWQTAAACLGHEGGHHWHHCQTSGSGCQWNDWVRSILFYHCLIRGHFWRGCHQLCHSFWSVGLQIEKKNAIKSVKLHQINLGKVLSRMPQFWEKLISIEQAIFKVIPMSGLRNSPVTKYHTNRWQKSSMAVKGCFHVDEFSWWQRKC